MFIGSRDPLLTRWMRVLGDTLFAAGAVAFVWFALDLMLRKPREEKVSAEGAVLVEVEA